MRPITIAVVAVLASAALADAPVRKGFWKILVKPKAKWVLYGPKKVSRLVVETHDVRKVGDADVARLRWTRIAGDGAKSNYTCDGCYTQVAVTSAGMYIVSDAKDDAQIAASLKAKPSRSDPPKPYKPTEENHERYLEIKGGLVCFGELTPCPDGDCEGTDHAEICISPDNGIVKVAGNWAPNLDDFKADGAD